VSIRLSQSPKPVLHPSRVQVPASQPGVPPATKQVFPQPPQLVRLDVVSTSQPSPGDPLQSASPAPQADTPQVPATQFGVPPLAEQARLQVPQFSTLVAVLVSQPFARSVSQLSKPPLHRIEQAPSAQEGVP
jgi:hypothetical protein